MKKRQNLKLRDVKPAKDPKGGKFRPKQRRGDGSGREGLNVPIKNLP